MDDAFLELASYVWNNPPIYGLIIAGTSNKKDGYEVGQFKISDKEVFSGKEVAFATKRGDKDFRLNDNTVYTFAMRSTTGAYIPTE